MIAKLSARLTILRGLEKPRDYGLFLHILGVALLAPWLLYLPLAQVARLLTPTPTRVRRQCPSAEQIIAYTDVVLQTCRPVVQDRCLTRGLTLYYFLGRSGNAVELHFGVGYIKRTFAGHCWLVKDGKPFAESGDPYQYFTPTYKFPLTAEPSRTTQQ